MKTFAGVCLAALLSACDLGMVSPVGSQVTQVSVPNGGPDAAYLQITLLKSDPHVVAPGGEVTFWAQAQSRLGSPCDFAWKAEDGTLLEDHGWKVSWLAPTDVATRSEHGIHLTVVSGAFTQTADLNIIVDPGL